MPIGGVKMLLIMVLTAYIAVAVFAIAAYWAVMALVQERKEHKRGDKCGNSGADSGAASCAEHHAA